ncbi:hypothetical protein [Bacillus sp. FJAT-29937]|uniref:hypothetical protein n=1 Tax=Bacillus sp. FJAT-29937 TaxID=1720553 RepID=UPI000834A037|nr:hypothetical protein [Bacillus sp. FJAT-29937]
MLKKVGRLAVAGALSLSLIGGLASETIRAEAAPIYPVEVKVNFEKGFSQAYQSEAVQPFVDVGNKKGTLVFKMYPNKEKGIWATNIWLAAKNNLAGNYLLMDGPSAIQDNTQGLYGFDVYSLWNQTGKKLISKYEAGFTNAGTAPNGKNYIALAVYLPKSLNSGRYYLQHSGMTNGYWDIKAYFYEDVDLEDALFLQVGKLFPLVGKVMWGKTEVKPGQIGRLTIKSPITLWKDIDGKLSPARTLNAGEQYRIYGYRSEHGGQYEMGGGYYVNKDADKALYETPSKARLRLAEILYKE